MTTEEIKKSLEAGNPVGAVSLTEKEYRDFPAYSRSELACMIHYGEIIPAEYIYRKGNPDRSPALAYGAALHKLVLQSDEFNDEYAVWDNTEFNRSTKVGKEAWENFISSNKGKKILNFSDKTGNSYENIYDMMVAIRFHELANSIVERSDHEESFFWVDDITGLWLKCRTDMRYMGENGPVIADYKSCQKANERGFRYDCLDYNYDLQVAWYSEGVEKCTGFPHDFQFVAQEKKPPHLVNVFDCPEEMYETGLQKMRTLLGVFKECLDSGNWYGYEGIFKTTTELTWYGKGDSDD